MRIKHVTRQGIIAAIYVVISLVFAPVSYGAIQFRMAEMFKVLPFYNKKYTVGITIGCFIVNLFSPMGVVDVIFGTAATLITCVMASHMKRIIYIAPVTAIVTGVIVGAELCVVLKLPFLPSVISVALGEFAVVLAGVIVAKALNKSKTSEGFLTND